MIKMALEIESLTYFSLTVENMKEAKAHEVELKGRWKRADECGAGHLEVGSYRRHRITDRWVEIREWRRGVR